MRVPTAVLALLTAAVPPAGAQSPPPEASRRPVPALSPPPSVEGYVVTVQVKAELAGAKPGESASPEAAALLGQFRSQSQFLSRVYLAQDLSRQEILSTDFVLPQGTLVLHRAGDRYYVVADPKAKTYAVLDADALLTVFEGSVGIENTQYDARVRHTAEQKVVAGVNCRKSVATVAYVTSIPLENDRVLVQQKNEIEVWHTSEVAAGAALEHFFFKYQRDRTGAVRKVLATELGFPMEVRMAVSFGSAAAGKAPKTPPGTIQMLVTEVRREKKLDSELFRLPPAGFQKLERLPYLR